MHAKRMMAFNAALAMLALLAFAAYHHQGELDSGNFLGAYPEKAGGKLVPQKVPSPPDRSSKDGDQAGPWPYRADWDHNAGSSTRAVTMIRVEPLPAGTTDIDTAEIGWRYIDEGKIVIYGAIAPPPHS